MTDGNTKCPPACKVELKHIQEGLEALKVMDITQWEEIAKRPRTAPLLWGVGLAVAVLCGLLGIIYNATQMTHSDIVGLKIQAERIETSLDNHMENSRDRYNTNSGSNTHGG